MKICVIDIGSNSVRLALIADGKTLYKRLATTRLGEGLSVAGRLAEKAVRRSALAVADFVSLSKAEGADKVYAFATAAVRSAENGRDFVDEVKRLCGVTVDVLSGAEEARCGLLGALKGGDGGIIDVGGASTEVSVCRGGKILYSESVNIGTVRLHDLAGRDREKLQEVIFQRLADYGAFDASAYKMRAIGGTASRLGSVKHNLMQYKPEITDGTVITLAEMRGLSDRLLTLSVEEIRATTICSTSADIVGGGCLLMYEVMRRFNVSEITVSESDNLEGYYMLKEGAQ